MPVDHCTEQRYVGSDPGANPGSGCKFTAGPSASPHGTGVPFGYKSSLELLSYHETSTASRTTCYNTMPQAEVSLQAQANVRARAGVQARASVQARTSIQTCTGMQAQACGKSGVTLDAKYED
ncbi:hypothetical protein BD779DRAFT_1805391 [Infundibulicybe gibba]|nr:hypothetical protein BD779DRAFT_1805391 [Infundibulicybe gibba]